MENVMKQIIDQGNTLSQCRIWPMIEEYYSTAGPDAWKETPYYVTSNAVIGDTYADLIIAFLRDSLPHLDRSQPVYILELATGCGAFSFFVLKALYEKLEYFKALEDIAICYVMTDFTEKNIAFWEAEPIFQALVEDGKLDFALFWPEIHPTITLRNSGVTLEHGTVTNPMIAIANYFFDSIRHDYFQFENGSIRESRPTLYRELNESVTESSSPLLSQIKLEDHFFPVTEDYYPETEFNELLAYYKANLSYGSVLFPLAPLRTLKNLCHITQNKLCLIASDKGVHSLDLMQGLVETPYVIHPGSFSYDVNFHALGLFFQNLGGMTWHAYENPEFTTMVGLSYDATEYENLNVAAINGLRKTNLIKNSFELSRFMDYFELRSTCTDSEKWENAVACIQLAGHDPWVFARFGEFLAAGLSQSSLSVKVILSEILEAVEANLFRPVFGCQDAYNHLRRLHYLMGNFDECQRLNETIIALYGLDRDAFFYPASLAEIRGNLPAALLFYQQALSYDPNSTLVQEAIAKVENALSASG